MDANHAYYNGHDKVIDAKNRTRERKLLSEKTAACPQLAQSRQEARKAQQDERELTLEVSILLFLFRLRPT